MITKEQIRNTPSTIGVYIFRKGKEVLYIGKSINIKARLNSHLENARLDRKESLIVSNSDSIETIASENEFKAVLLEAGMIRKIKPKYNAVWKDDKSLLYIAITIKEKFPKVLLIRRPDEAGKKLIYFGPFSSVKETTALVSDLRKITPFCTQKKLSKLACFYSKINQCHPCPNKIHNLPEGEEKTKLKKVYRKNIRNVIKVLQGKTNQLLKVFQKHLKNLTAAQKYEEAIVVRNKIYRLERLNHFSFTKQDIYKNRIEEYLKLSLELFKKYFPKLKALKRIEGYDISNLGFDHPVGSMVVLNEGIIDKKQYRKFKIRGKNYSDFDRLYEVLRRRFNQSWTIPDLIMVDGGRPQVKIAVDVLTRLGKDIPIIGLAKNPDRYVIGIVGFPTVKPEMDDPGFNLLRLLRNESHRFARKYHLFLRERNFLV